MRYALIGLVLCGWLMAGCGARTASSSSGGNDANPNNNTDNGGGPWYDGHGDPVDPNDNAFSGLEFTLVATTVGAGTVEPSAGVFEGGEEVTLTAVPDDGWAFDHWEGDVSGTEAVITITIEHDTVVVAWFVDLPTPPDNGNDNSDDGASTLEPGDSFETAPLVDWGSNGTITIDQILARASDVHVYDLGALAQGDRLIVACEARTGSELDPLIALFDADGFRVFWNDDVDLEGGDYDSSINDLIRHDSAHHYLAVTSTDYAETTGAYRLTVEVQQDAATPQFSGQTLVLDFDGEPTVTVAGQNWGTFATFDAADLGPAFTGQTAALQAAILAIVETDYAPYNVTVWSTDDPTPTEPFSKVFVGGDSDMLFGIADNIDFYNADHEDNVVVFALAFSGLTSSLEAMGQALGNVVSHEVGHVLGLMHTTDVTEIMDTTGAADTLLVDQQFGTAAVYDFPIGFQNAPLLLEETLGLTARPRIIVRDGYLRCGTCGARLYKLSGPRTER